MVVSLEQLEIYKENLKYIAKNEARVGIFAGTKARPNDKDVTNVTLGYVHQYGSVKQGIPARPWLDRPFEMKKADYKAKQKELLRSGDMFEKGGGKKVLQKLAYYGLSLIQDGFQTNGYGTWLPLKQATIARRPLKGRAGAKPLLDTREFFRSITTEIVANQDSE